MTPKYNLKKLKEKARDIRIKVLEEIYRTGKGHIGGTFSCIEILTTLYYCGFIQPNFQIKKRGFAANRFILSKGHACLGLYSIFLDLGIISAKKFKSYGSDGGLGGQLDRSLPGVDFNTGSLGHSVGVGSGMALALKLDKKRLKVFTLIGDSELFEGSVWEAIIFAGDNKIDNLVCIVDRNRFTVTEELKDNSIYNALCKKLETMNWNCIDIDGHDFNQIDEALKKVSVSPKPSMIIANTIKGKGVSFMENGLDWYTQSPTPEEFSKAKKELLSKYEA